MAADYYDLLGVSKNATDDEIKKAYKKMAMKHHPDRNKGDKIAEQKFKEISEAYEILKDQQKRNTYDEVGHDNFKNTASYGDASGFSGGQSGFSGFGFDDIINELFGRRSRSGFASGASSAPVRQPGADVRYDLSISLDEAYFGIEKEIKYKIYGSCKSCTGTGSADKSSPKVCSACRGAGVVRSQQGFFTVERTCPKCLGAGEGISSPCNDCGGTGRAIIEKKLQIKIPRGVDNGTKIKIEKEGEAGVRGGSLGDLFVFVTVKSHKIFERRARDLFTKIPISFVKASLGAEIKVCGLNKEEEKLIIQAGTQNGTELKLKGFGMPTLRGNGCGDLIVELQIETPVNLSKKQKELLAQFASEGNEKINNPSSDKIFQKIKDFFS